MIDHDHKDTFVIAFNGNNYQPVFIKNKKDTLNFDFSIESVVFTSSNGHKLNGWFLKPKNSIPTTTLLHFHGNAGSVLSQYRGLSPLVKNNFQVFVFDYSGFGFSEGKATRKNVLTDALSALDYVKSRADVANTRLVIYGQSLGGHLSAVVAAKREKDIDALVIEGAFSSHPDIAAVFARKLFLLGCVGRVFTKCGYSAKRSIQQYHKPVLIIHSTEDEVIPFSQGQKLFAKANQPKEFYEIKKCHICGPTFYPNEISGKINKMLNK
jgi:fermentation-respiration switch protein FrsA (DUF1100 family)